MLGVGPTYPHKNFERLIDAYNNLPDVIKQKYPLVIAGGKKKYENHLKQYVKTVKLEKNVHFLGYVPIELMPSLYREALALVFPSLYEGFGIPLLEAMACGCAVVGFDSIGGRDYFEHGENAYIVNYGDFEGLAEEVDPELKVEEIYQRIIH